MECHTLSSSKLVSKSTTWLNHLITYVNIRNMTSKDSKRINVISAPQASRSITRINHQYRRIPYRSSRMWTRTEKRWQSKTQLDWIEHPKQESYVLCKQPDQDSHVCSTNGLHDHSSQLWFDLISREFTSSYPFHPLKKTRGIDCQDWMTTPKLVLNDQRICDKVFSMLAMLWNDG